jgi:hypothetical protein
MFLYLSYGTKLRTIRSNRLIIDRQEKSKCSTVKDITGFCLATVHCRASDAFSSILFPKGNDIL